MLQKAPNKSLAAAIGLSLAHQCSHLDPKRESIAFLPQGINGSNFEWLSPTSPT